MDNVPLTELPERLQELMRERGLVSQGETDETDVVNVPVQA